MKLRTKILLGYGAAVLAVLVVLGWAVLNLGRLATAADAILEENYRSILAAENMVGSLERQDSGLLLLLLGFEEQGVTEFSQGEADFLQWLGRAKDNITLPGEAATLASIESGYRRFLARSTALRVTRAAGGDASSLYQGEVLPLFREVRREAVRLRELNQASMVAYSERARSVGRRAIVSTLVVGLALSVIGLVLSGVFSRQLVRPIEAMSAAARRIAEERYDVVLPTPSSDELGTLAADLSMMAQKLEGFHRLNVDKVIAEKRRSDAIIHSIADGLVLVNGDLEVVAINPRAAEILEADAGGAVGAHLSKLFKEPELFERVRMEIERPGPPRPGVDDLVLTVPADESARHYGILINEVSSGAGQPLGWVILLQDVTRYKELDRLKTEFVAIASHELRTPLTGISMSLDLLHESAEDALAERDRELLEVAREDVRRLRMLVNELLDLSRIESGRLEMDFERTDLRGVIEDLVATFRPQAEERGIELATELPDAVPDVRADPTKIGLVLSNLVSNALRYTDEGGHILVSVDVVRQFVQVSVSDDGTGIPFELQARIFGKFVQVPGQRAGGAGLGLAISKEIVHAHGGTLWVDSTPGQGSTFAFILPTLPATRTITGGIANG